MPKFCAVFGCSNRSNREKNKSFFRVPKVVTHRCEKYKQLTEKRRQTWIRNLRLKSRGAESVNARVCSDHFVKGCPSAVYDEEDEDWAPTVRLGYNRETPETEASGKQEERSGVRRKTPQDPGEDSDPLPVTVSHVTPSLTALSHSTNQDLQLNKSFLSFHGSFVFPADVQQLLVCKEEPPEEQEWSPGLDQEDMKPQHIKEEQEDLWSNQKEEQLEGPEETDIIKFKFSPIPVKSEDDEEKPRFSLLHQRQTEQMGAGADGGDRRRSEQAKSFGSETKVKTEDSSEPETDDSADWTETTEQKPGINSEDISKNKRQEKLHCCSLCGRSFIKKASLRSHMRIHTGPKSFICPECGKGYFFPRSVTRHLKIHARQRLFSKIPNNKWTLSRHVIINKGEKTFTCSECGKRFKQKSYLTLNMANPKKPFSCIYCGQGFDLFDHLRIHKCAGSQALESPRTVEKTGTAKEDCGGSEKARSSYPERHLQLETEGKTANSLKAETEDSADRKETTGHQTSLKPMKTIKIMTRNTDKQSHCCIACRKILNKNVTLKVI